MPWHFAKHTLTCTYNDLASSKRRENAFRIILARTRSGQYELRPAAAGISAVSAALCDEFGALLIIDEVMTGFRVSAGRGVRDITASCLTHLLKIIGGGMPVGARLAVVEM